MCKFSRGVVMLAGEWKIKFAILIIYVHCIPSSYSSTRKLSLNFQFPCVSVCVCVCACVWQCLKGLMAEEIREYNVASDAHSVSHR